VREKSFEDMTLDEVFDLEDRYTANAGHSVVSNEGIARWKHELGRKARRRVIARKRRTTSKVAAR